MSQKRGDTIKVINSTPYGTLVWNWYPAPLILSRLQYCCLSTSTGDSGQSQVRWRYQQIREVSFLHLSEWTMNAYWLVGSWNPREKQLYLLFHEREKLVELSLIGNLTTLTQQMLWFYRGEALYHDDESPNITQWPNCLFISSFLNRNWFCHSSFFNVTPLFTQNKPSN